MDFIKKNVFMIVCAGVCVVGIALYAMGYLQGGKNKKALEDLARSCSKVKGLRVVVNDEVKAVLNNKKIAQQKLDSFVNTVKMSTARELIEPKVFPKPTESAQIYYSKFGKKYCQMLKAFNSPELLNASDKPSFQDEQQYLDKHLIRGRGGMGATGTGRNAKTAEDTLLEALRKDRANEISMYVPLGAYVAYDYWNVHDGDSNSEEVIEQESWYSQVAYWIQQDVIFSIAAMNNKDKNVQENPVKRLIEISFSGQTVTPATRTSASRNASSVGRTGTRGDSGKAIERSISANTLPAYVIKPKARTGRNAASASEGKPSGAIAIGYTKNTSDELVDIVQFEIAVVLDAQKTRDFMKELQSIKDQGKPEMRNQIACLDIEVSSLNNEAEMRAGYYYGGGALSLVRVLCEYRFFKSGYEQYMPEHIRETISSTDDSGGR